VPLIASQAGALPEIVIDGVTGLLVPPKSPQQLADAMEALASDPARRASMGEAGQRRVRETFAADKMVDATAALYEELAGKD
jgi:glycosyltransferase involved in cell wall biosynthesis